MTVARRREPALAHRIEALDRVLELAPGRVDAARLEEAQIVRRKADARLARGDGLVVAALVGGTGSGKSSLCNALVSADVAPVGVRRPTTEHPRAVVGMPAGDAADAAPSDGGAGALLDWLEIPERHEGGPAVPEGLILLDVPDHDSVAVDHRKTVDRLIERVDVLIWVVDPIKYAMRALHQGYLGGMVTHAEALIVVLNRIDELSEADRDVCAADLRRLLDAEGLERARLLTTSARTGMGVRRLRAELAEEAAQHQSAARRLVGDLRAVGGSLAEDIGDEPPGPLDTTGVVEALAGAAGVAGVAASAEDESLAAAMEGTRPIVSRGGAAIVTNGPVLLRHIRGLFPGERPAERPPAHAAPVGVRHAVVEVVDRAVAPLPVRWRPRLHEAVGVDSGALARSVAKAIDRVPLRSPRRGWWRPLALALSLAEVVALVGFVWLLVLGVLGWLQLPAPEPVIAFGRIAWPPVLLLGGLAARVIGGVVRRRAVATGARRHRDRVARQLLEAVQEVAAEKVIAPLRAEIDVREELRALLGTLRA
jgi:GTP-binding protein EngB required for normal cell division